MTRSQGVKNDLRAGMAAFIDRSTSAGDDISFFSKPHWGSIGHQCLRDSAPASFLPPRFCASKIERGRRGACPSFDRPIGHRSEERKGRILVIETITGTRSE